MKYTNKCERDLFWKGKFDGPMFAQWFTGLARGWWEFGQQSCDHYSAIVYSDNGIGYPRVDAPLVETLSVKHAWCVNSTI